MKYCKTLVVIMFALLLEFPVAHGKTEEKTEISNISVSSTDFIMGEFEAKRVDYVSFAGHHYCEKMTITVYEIEGAKGSYYALIDGQKYKVTEKEGKNVWGERDGWDLYDCDKKYQTLFYFAVTYNAKTWYFNMPVR